MKLIARPTNLDLFRIHLPMPGWVSILHRVSGALLFLSLPFGVWLLSLSLSDAAGYQRVSGWLAHPLSRLALLLGIWMFSHHVFAGLRHLALDVHWGVELRQARLSSLVVMSASGVVTLLAAWKLFA